MQSSIARRLLFVSVIVVLLQAVGCSTLSRRAAYAPEEFTVVILPDTQKYSLEHPDAYFAQTSWIKEHAKSDNIRFVIHLGDIVNDNTLPEWEVADEAHRILDGVVPYSVVPGNHDMAKKDGAQTRDTSRYNEFFPPARFERCPWYGGHLGETNDNNYCRFDAGNLKFLVVSLEFAPTGAALEWAGEVIAKHRDRRVIVATHCYMNTEDRDMSSPQDYRLAGNSGQQVWDKLVRRHDNIFLVVSGHIAGVGLKTSINDAGRTVYEMLVDYQRLPNGGDGWLRTLRFLPGEDTIRVEAYSPLLDEYNLDPAHTYMLDYDMAEARAKSPRPAKVRSLASLRN